MGIEFSVTGGGTFKVFRFNNESDESKEEWFALGDVSETGRPHTTESERHGLELSSVLIKAVTVKEEMLSRLFL